MEAQNRPIEVPNFQKQRKWWFQDSGLRRLYALMFIAILSSATNGYDGSMMNGLQALDPWKTCKPQSRLNKVLADRTNNQTSITQEDQN